jgi:hypothetical protein
VNDTLIPEKKMVRVTAIFLLVAIMEITAVSEVKVTSLRAGAARQDITREKPKVPVNDALFAKALVFDNGKTKVVIIAIDLGGVNSDFVAKVRQRVQDELQIKGQNVLINASHNHHTQGQVAKDVIERAVSAVKIAAENMVPVTIGVGVGRENRITMNRRIRLKNGKSWTIRRAIPCPPDAEIASVGPFDPEIGILRVDRLNGETMAVVYNFAGHAYGGVPNKGVTADFPGFASGIIEENLGSDVIALFLQGAAGDITTILYKDVNTPRPTEILGKMLGLSTLKATKKIQTKNEDTLKVVTENIKLPRRTDIPERIKSLRAQQEKILLFFTQIGCGTHGAGSSLNFETFLPLYLKQMMNPESPSYYSYRYKQEELTGRDDLKWLDADNKRDVQKYLQNIYAMERLIKIQVNLRVLEQRQAKAVRGPIACEIQGVKIGDFVLITYPGELFAQIGLDIKKKSPYEHTFVAAYSNGSVGYSPTADAYEEEAYEEILARLAPEWREIYEKKALEIINKLY